MEPIFNAVEYDGINSLKQGVFITGESVYNAPERDVEQIEIPGRSGNYLLDKGRWKNIDVTYHCGIFGNNQEDFAEKIRAFRNMLASRYGGYKRIVDTYNPDEYRMGIFKSNIDVDKSAAKRAGEFDLVFTCQPQRYLMSGEAKVDVANGESVYNPTPYESSPLIEAKGPGKINMNGHIIQINDVVVGTINVSDKISLQNRDLDRTWDINDAMYNPGDLVTIPSMTVRSTFTITNSATFLDTKSDRTMGIEYYNTVDSDATLLYNKSGKTATFGITIPTTTLTIGQTLSKTYRIRATVIVDNGDRWQSNRIYCSYGVEYSNGNLHVYAEDLRFNTEGSVSIAAPRESCTITLGAITGESTLSTLNDLIYIDCETGDAYIVKDGEIVSFNSTIQLGSDLPVLSPGDNSITYDNTITEFRITPRWWIL